MCTAEMNQHWIELQRNEMKWPRLANVKLKASKLLWTSTSNKTDIEQNKTVSLANGPNATYNLIWQFPISLCAGFAMELHWNCTFNWSLDSVSSFFFLQSLGQVLCQFTMHGLYVWCFCLAFSSVFYFFSGAFARKMLAYCPRKRQKNKCANRTEVER